MPHRSCTGLQAWVQQLSQCAHAGFDVEGQALLHGLRQAAAEVERLIRSQQARIRFLECLSITDELTGLLNRRGFHQELARTRARAARSAEAGLLLLCDLNDFKAINDRFGHLVGDRVLCGVARLLQANTRRSDCVARLGGDEFAILLTNTPRALGEELAVNLETTVNRHILVYQGRRIPISASFGCEPYGLDSPPDAILGSADRALYRNKAPRAAAAPDA